jgi:hypothetical protein
MGASNRYKISMEQTYFLEKEVAIPILVSNSSKLQQLCSNCDTDSVIMNAKTKICINIDYISLVNQQICFH